MTALIEIRKVRKYYSAVQDKMEDIEALSEINLSISAGEFVCLLGPSGCGKSTLLKLLAGFIEPSSGEIRIGGKAVQGPGAERAVVFQQPNLYPWLSCGDNIRFGPRMRGCSKEECAKIEEKWLSAVHLAGFADVFPFELSGGMQQRVALARVLANEPEIVLMDEPLAALDAITRIEMQQLIRDIRRQSGCTFFMITHDMDEALSLADRILIMSARPGRIVESLRTDFSATADASSYGRVKITPEYLAMRDHIFSLISGS